MMMKPEVHVETTPTERVRERQRDRRGIPKKRRKNLVPFRENSGDFDETKY